MAFLRSLRARVLLWVSVALTALFALTVAALDVTFRETTDGARRELLEVQLLGLAGLAEPTDDGRLVLPTDAINPEFSVADSGLYGMLWDSAGNVVWSSLSLLGGEPPLTPALDEGETRRFVLVDAPNAPLEALLMRIAFDDATEPYVFGIAVSLTPYLERQAAFRRYLIAWFATITLVTLLVLTVLLRVVLRPLGTLERQVREVEAGRRQRLDGAFPSELIPLAGNLNALIETERRRLVRYRNMLDDLAHALKTPLAAMRSLLAEFRDPGPNAEDLPSALAREVERMDQRVSYQLRRARASGATGLGVEPVAVAPVVDDLKHTLDKVYREKGVELTTRIVPGAVFHGDPGDLTELLGNLLDNAYKYCRAKVSLVVETRPDRLVLRIGDDGPGISPEEVERLVERGVRADESTPGQGIGLAVVRETVELYGGALAVERSPLGGAEVVVELGRAGFVL
ncbi:MAG: ATP-binding protein [Gammaproteobacteria bacterium]|nr:hypothetical protein [Gammaproteobacteria bacterium]